MESACKGNGVEHRIRSMCGKIKLLAQNITGLWVNGTTPELEKRREEKKERKKEQPNFFFQMKEKKK